MAGYIKKFNEINLDDIKTVGGKNASLGEMVSKLSSKGIMVPDGFATTAYAFEEFLRLNFLHTPLENILKKLNRNDYSNLQEVGLAARTLLLEASLSAACQADIIKAYKELCQDDYFPVAVTTTRQMATDGVKVIDGDTAHDTYWEIINLYDNGATVEDISNKIPFPQSDYYDDFDYEIYTTAYALAMWEVGFMSDDILKEVKRVIEKGACVKRWAEEYDPKYGKARQKVLEKFWDKISRPNLKTRKRKKYKQIINPYFKPDDLLTFKTKDNFYRVVVCAEVNKYKSTCDYVLVPTTYKGLNKPTSDDLLEYEILGTRIASGYDKKTTLDMQNGVDTLWKLFPEKMDFMPDPPHFFIGLVQNLISHKNMTNIKDNFEIIGQLRIKDSFKRLGSAGYTSDFQRFEDSFIDLEKRIVIFKQSKFPVRIICET